MKRRMDFWTTNRINVLVTCWAAGETGAAIAELLGCSRCAILGKLNRLGLIGAMNPSERSARQSAGLNRSWDRRGRVMSASQKRKISASISRWWEARQRMEAQS